MVGVGKRLALLDPIIHSEVPNPPTGKVVCEFQLLSMGTSKRISSYFICSF